VNSAVAGDSSTSLQRGSVSSTSSVAGSGSASVETPHRK
jgi:hypothetical protein